LDQHAPPDPGRLAACRTELQRGLERDVQSVEALLAAGQRAGAQAALTALDARYGGLAAEQSLHLAERLDRNH
jgi:hypothetical protein